MCIRDRTKATGKSEGKGITWQGHAGMIAGSTPAIYRHFSEVADMGERFISYRMKNMDQDKAVDFIMEHGQSAMMTDEKIKNIYGKYMSSVMESIDMSKVKIDKETQKTIINVAKICTRFRTPVMTDDRDHYVTEIPVPEFPFRVMKQLESLAKAFAIMTYHDTNRYVLSDELRSTIEWVGYSMADDKRRRYFRALLECERMDVRPTLRNISSCTGIHRTPVERGMSILSAIDIVKMLSLIHISEPTRPY